MPFAKPPELASGIAPLTGTIGSKDRLVKSEESLVIFTIGHSTHPIERFLELLETNRVTQLIDIRTIPRSRHNPQFDSQALRASLRTAHIQYVHLKELGGLRRARQDSINLGWRNLSFRGFADYMQTPEFEAALAAAIEWASARRTALMCAEAVPWRCHRSLVADALIVRGIRVLEIVSTRPPTEHQLTSFARVCGTSITYPGDQALLV
ncbi:MAG TPA: DUF488 domain-containing protein [Candidatus Acidoferrales bacterium]|nr:DUF488 domain-containing protein [Candidatus Acidoferrales bacterium]